MRWNYDTDSRKTFMVFDEDTPEEAGCVCREVRTEAHARLIAAAPDLLEAIFLSDDAHWTPAMRAAIAKATGTS